MVRELFNGWYSQYRIADPITGTMLLGTLNQESFCMGI